MQAQVLVTGGTGFIGRHLVRLLLERNQAVRVLCRCESKAVELFGAEVEIFRGDLLDARSVDRACVEISHVFHVGGAYCFGLRNRRELMAANVTGTRHVLESAWKHGVEKVVHVSSASLFGGGSEGAARSNGFPLRPIIGGHYKKSKWLAELCAREWADRGLPVSIASPTCPIGPGDEKPTPTGRMILDFLRGRFPAISRTGLNFISARDLAEGLVAVSQRGRKGESYVLGHRNMWLGEFLEILARHTGLPMPRVTLPWPLIAAAGLLGEVAGLFSAKRGQRLCWETAWHAREVYFPDLSGVSDELGWRAREPIEEAARCAADWFQESMAAPRWPGKEVPLDNVLAH